MIANSSFVHANCYHDNDIRFLIDILQIKTFINYNLVALNLNLNSRIAQTLLLVPPS
jgi:hypothetical protein